VYNTLPGLMGSRTRVYNTLPGLMGSRTRVYNTLPGLMGSLPGFKRRCRVGTDKE